MHNSASMTLDEVITVMVDAFKKNKTIARLHTGDPSLYGAIREQMDALKSHDIPYEVIPGVSSFLGAAAALRTEFTLPGVSQTVILTRMEGRTSVPEKESIERLASHNATMVIFLSTTMLEELTKRLLAGGYKRDTRAAIVYKATWDDQKVVRTTVEGLAQAARENDIAKTALILVGDFLGDDYELSKLYDPSFSHEYRGGLQK